MVKRKQSIYLSLGQNIRMLKFRGDMHNLNVPLVDKFSKKMMTYINVL